MNELMEYINREIAIVNGRVFCDTAPVLDRYWAWRAGLGWIGKNTQLIIPKAGSSFFWENFSSILNWHMILH